MNNTTRLFIASCIAMATTSMIFAIRGDIEPMLSTRFHLTSEQMGLIWGPAFYGFTLSVFISGFVVDVIGMRRLFQVSAAGFLLGIVMIILAPAQAGPVSSIFAAPGPVMLYLGFLVMGLSQGLVEGVINPLITTLFKDQKTTKLNALHAWWPCGLIVGGLTALVFTALGAPWQVKLASIAIPTLAYVTMTWRMTFPSTERRQNNVPASVMVREPLQPFFLIMFCCMWGTSITELGADQWFPTIMKDLTGLDGILFLIYTGGIVFLMRTFAGRLVHRSPFLSQILCCALSAAGLWMLGSLQPGTPLAVAFFAATLFGIGKSLLWPTMLGITAERFPKGGALCIGIIGGTGFLSIAVALPVIGHALDHYGPQEALRLLALLPTALVAVFGLIYLKFWLAGGYQAVQLAAEYPVSLSHESIG